MERDGRDATLVPLLREEMVAWETLEERYGGLLELVEVLLGVVPNCDRYLEIWPPAFRSYDARSWPGCGTVAPGARSRSCCARTSTHGPR